jgi:putative transcriptional regulator
MSKFGDDLIHALGEALAHAKGKGKGKGKAILHAPVDPAKVRKAAKLTQAQMAPLMGMSLSGYRKWEQGARNISGPAAALLRVIEREPAAVKRALGG